MYELVYNFGDDYSKTSGILRRLETRFYLIPRARHDGYALQIVKDSRNRVVEFIKEQYGIEPVREGEDTRN